MAPPPIVTGISPKDGPPGTKVTIRGEFLGRQATDLKGLEICGIDCLLSAEWVSANKITARTGPAKGKGDIIVTTLSGGQGTSTVQFRSYYETIGPLKESAVWVDEAPNQSLSWGRRVLTPNTQEDPLGLCIESTDKKVPEDLREIFPDGCGDLTQENFSPGWFLLENHLSTSFDDLKAGLKYLRRKVESQKEGQLSFLKSNAGSVMDQLDTLVNLRDRFSHDVEVHGIKQIEDLESAIRKSIDTSHDLFTDVLARREKADSARQALAALSRHKFLFCLPNAIERGAKNGDFDIVCNDYARARNLFGRTEVMIFKQVLVEVDQRVIEVKKILHEKIQEMPQGVEQQKKLVKALINLENQQINAGISEKYSVEDPAWYAINARAKYLSATFKTTYESYLAKETPSVSKRNDATVTPNRLLFCEEMNEIASGQIPDLWRIGQAYFTGELKGGCDPKPNNFKVIILSTIEEFCSCLRAALLPTTPNQRLYDTTEIAKWPATISSNHQFAIWIPQCLRFVRVTYATLIRLDLPSEALDIVSKLINDLRLYSLITILKRTNDKVKKFVEKEMWEIKVPEFPGATLLPSKLVDVITETLGEAQHICLVPEVRETILIEPHSDGQREVSRKVQDILNAFCAVIEGLAMERTEEDAQSATTISQLIGFPTEMHSVSDRNWGALLSWEQRLLCCLANCAYCNQKVFNKIETIFTNFSLSNVKLSVEYGRGMVNELFAKLLEVYVEHKSDPLVGTIEPSMYIGRFQWNEVADVGKLSPYAHECCDNLVGVYSEIFAISPFLLRPILEPIVQMVAEELARLMSCVQGFNVLGAMQAYVDINVIQDALKVYSNSKAKTFFNEALEPISSLDNADRKQANEIVADIKQKMKLQLMCLQVV